MKKIFSFVLFLVSSFVFAQISTENELRLKVLREKRVEFNKKMDGEYEGFRVKIHFGVDKEKARQIKSAFLKKFSEIPAYEKYMQPNFAIMVGDFRTKMEAYECCKKIKLEFPNAFIIKDRIRPIGL